MLGNSGVTVTPNIDSVTGTTDSLQVNQTLHLNGTGATEDGSVVGALWSFTGINTYTGPITLNGTAAIGVTLPGTDGDADQPTATPSNYDVLGNGLATDDTLTITGAGLTWGRGPVRKSWAGPAHPAQFQSQFVGKYPSRPGVDHDCG